MPPVLSESQCRHLRMIFERGAAAASLALSRWLGEDVRLSISEVEQVDLAEAAGVLGPAEALVAACAMGLSGPLGGQILLVFEDRAGLALADLLLRQPPGTAKDWGELERSAAMETTNIVGCAYLNALAAHLPGGLAKPDGGDGPGEELVPSPPTFLHEFAGSLLEFALMDQALELDRVLLVHTAFATGRRELSLDWTLLFVPDHASLRALAGAIGELESH
ncbi:CheY-P phosphatase CheC [Aquisphaera giovannonii]|uniref:CheY-P phosphatase CheC n=1 Tax=Aquisphaera giovannonii TaxID=406548 RepID=A0A5B9VUB8_9BACT|nr:chemotaxis protein CheC [Aquisphaera giovannonii]QEH31674.1 CheY-P phosphatase CheC [Aquisphaera giovannonii]